MNLQSTYSVGIYARLSRDDERAGESMSIENQRKMLTDYATGQPGWVVEKEYIDDGWSGATMERPGFQRMIQDAKDGVINLILCKDMSRFGRNYIEVGRYTDYILPMLGCRLVAPGDNADTLAGENDILPYRNLFNEFLCRDTSKKVRAVIRMNAEKGKFMGSYAPYGYQKDSENKHRLIPNPATAPTACRIFEMRASGMGYRAIAAALNDEGILTPRKSWYSEQGREMSNARELLWNSVVISNMLKNEAYIGNLVQCRQGSLSYKNHKQIKRPEDEWIRALNTHEPIVTNELWDKVQELSERRYKPRAAAVGGTNIYSGLLKCADCGHSMRWQTRYNRRLDGSEEMIKYFLCSYYSGSGKSACTAHIIKESVVTEMVLADIRRSAAMVVTDEKRVVDAIVRMRKTDSVSRLSGYRQELRAIKARISELERLISSLYEDRSRGDVPESVFKTLMNRYENERLSKAESAERLEVRIAEAERGWGDASQWTGIIRKYTDLDTLDAATLLELVDRIEVSAAKEINGERVMDVRVVYRFMENIDMDALESEVRCEQAV